MSTAKDARRLTGYTDNSQPLYDDDMEDYQHYNHIEDDVYDEYDEDLDDVLGNSNKQDDDEEDDDTGSELSIPDPNIDFDMVYALHTFAATVEGQASVVRGDALTLLDDSNSYWWLVKVLKTAEVGYIPAENIETPHERLARLNSHRNIELTRKDIQDAFPTPPSNKVKKTKRVTLAKGVQFQSQIIFGSSDDEDDFFESQFEQWDERMQSDLSDMSDDSDVDSEDPYDYYDHATATTNARQSYSEQSDNLYASYTDKQDDYYTEARLSGDSDILNDREPSNRDTLNLDEETIKISLTPSIARDDHRSSDSSITGKLKKAAKLDQLLRSSSPEEPQQERRGSKDSNSKKEKSGIRKFFSRSNSKSKSANTLERQSSGGSQYETASISSQSTGIVSVLDRDRSGSLDSTIQQQGTELKIHAGNINHFVNTSGLMQSYKYVTAYPSTTATDLIHMALTDQEQLQQQDMTYHDFYLIVRTLGGDECTLVPSDKPLEIFHSLTAHLNTPMPSLKKARRISQLMGSDNGTHMGRPSKELANEDEVQFYLLSKTKRIDDGEIQIKVSLFPSQLQQQASDDVTKRVDKLVKIPSSILIKDAVTLLLEKFHILNGVVAGPQTEDDIKSLRLSEQDILKYHLAVNKNGQEYLLDLEEKLLNVFEDDQIPNIHYRRNSNPDRTSITVNITPPEKDEIFFILKCVESKKKEDVEDSRHHRPHHHHLVRQDTPMPRQETTPTDGFKYDRAPSLPQYQPQVILAEEINRELSGSPIELSSSPPSENILSQLDEAIDTLNKSTTQPQRVRPESSESMLYCNDFGMNDLMVMIRGAASAQEKKLTGRNSNRPIRSEISEVFKDSHTRLDQLEKELDRLMSEAVKVYH
ncbi:uncharacterized protein EV154DRAFT_536709 [Mucor mucedo]|uniref:uncharacterized protein n=1 Tax=Mucor mucedo TaxID=29922 RepID=UPI00221FCF79|nr:uncharacterized protein EV154DRAFT_536709 [Mucor mucedo]KAI7894088.1 hypothetical protein EV154DRAFT_536709 [Mucor mucedo]